MNRRKLRIAWSAAWGIAALLLVALWVRSCFWLDRIEGPGFAGDQDFTLASAGGTLLWDWESAPIPQPSFPKWEVKHKRFIEPGPHTFWWWTDCRVSHQYIRLHIPYSLMVAVAAFIALISQFHYSARFSLRTLLITTTLIAIGLALICR